MKRLEHISPGAVLAGTSVVFLLPVILVGLFPSQLDTVIEKSTYLVFHNVAEFFSIMVSLSVFSVGWCTFEQSRDRHALFLGSAFLAVALLDFMHTMSNAAMPAFISPNSTNKSTQFWIAARLINSSAFLVSAYVYPMKENRWLTKYTLMAAAVAISGVAFTLIVFFPSALPATAVQGVGLTPLKRYLEFLVILLLFCAVAAYWKRMARTGNRDLVIYPAALIICIYSEIFFASYKTGFDTYNVLGHIYKVIAFYLIYKGVFISSVNHPYLSLSDAIEKLRMETVSRSDLETEVEERKKAEKVLHAREADLNEAQRLAHIGSWYWDAKTDVTTGSNELLRIYGLDPATQSMPDFRDQRGRCYPVEEWERVDAAVQRTVETGVGYELDVRALRNGTAIWVTTRGEAVRDDNNRIIGLRGTVQDITERKQVEETLRLSEEKFSLAFANNSAAIAMTRLEDGLFIEVNDTWLAMNGYSRDEVIGFSARKLPVWPTVEAAARFIQELREKGTLRGWEQEFLKKSGEIYVAQLSAHLLTVRDETVILSTVVDITDRKRAEQKIARQMEEVRILNEDLTRFNKSFVSREFRMIELKKEINEICVQIGMQPRYPLEFEKGHE
jgi:PAS domain S-box-containing protein